MSTQLQKQFQILLIGDRAIDRYILGEIKRISPEAPVPVIDKHEVVEKQGMALNVQANLSAFNVKIDTCLGTRTSVKTRIVDKKSGYHLLRIDQDQKSSPVTLDKKLDVYDAIVVSDYDKGSVSYETYEFIKNNYQGPVFVDTKKTDLERLNGFFIKVNEDEFHKLVTTAENVIVTKGKEGASLNGKNYPGSDVVVKDVCGAGDTFLSALVYYFLVSKNIDVAISFANKAAGISVQHSGVYVLTKEDIDALSR